MEGCCPTLFLNNCVGSEWLYKLNVCLIYFGVIEDLGHMKRLYRAFVHAILNCQPFLSDFRIFVNALVTFFFFFLFTSFLYVFFPFIFLLLFLLIDARKIFINLFPHVHGSLLGDILLIFLLPYAITITRVVVCARNEILSLDVLHDFDNFFIKVIVNLIDILEFLSRLVRTRAIIIIFLRDNRAEFFAYVVQAHLRKLLLGLCIIFLIVFLKLLFFQSSVFIKKVIILRKILLRLL